MSSSQTTLEDNERRISRIQTIRTGFARGHQLCLMSGRRHNTVPLDSGGEQGLGHGRPVILDRFKSMKRRNWEHGFVSVVLLCQIACLTMFAFAEDLIRQSKWVGALFGFSFLFGLILSLGFYGMWRTRSDELTLFRFLQAEPVYLAVTIATAGLAASILLVKSG